MRRAILVPFLACLGWPILGAAHDAAETERIADMMVRLCVGGGRTEATTGAAAGGADLSLRSLDVKGNLEGKFKINKSSAEGLVNGLDNALSRVAADQADKVRACLQPVRERLLDVMLPPKRQGSNKDFDNVDTWSVSFTIGGIISNGPGQTGEYYLMIQGCDFSNVSATQKRVLDFKIEISTKMDSQPDIALDTADADFQPEVWPSKDVGRRSGTLANPLILEPGGFAEGSVEFAMNADQSIKWQEIIDHHLLNKMYENSVLYVIDRRSGLTKKTKLAEHYDAITGSVWRAGCPASLPRKNGTC